MPLDQPGTRSREGMASLEGSAFFTEQDIKDLAGQLAVVIFGPALRERELHVSARKRRGFRFDPGPVPVTDRTTAGATGDAVTVAERQQDRLEVWLKAPATNTGTVFVSNRKNVKGVFGDPDSGWPVDPGESVIIDTSDDALYATGQEGKGPQTLYRYEAVQQG